MDTPALKNICTQVRRDIINMTANAGSGHPGGSLSAVEMLVALYFDVMTGLQIDGSNDEVMSLGDLHAKFTSFGYNVIELADGNDIEAVLAALKIPPMKGKPTLILCHTHKGKGISFMEDQVGWHGKAPNEQQRAEALKELEG